MSTFKASADTRFIAQEFAKAAPGDTITYEQLSAAISRDVRKFAQSSIYTALKMQLAEGRVFEAEPGIGYRFLTSAEIVQTQAAKGFQRIGRIAKKTARKVGAADFASLSNPDKIKHNAQLSMLGALGQMTKPAALVPVEKRVSEKLDQLAIGETLKLMTG